jgi:translation initiation factor IF-3
MINKPFNRFQNKYPKKDDGGYKINEKIYAKTIRLIREGMEPIVCDTSDAISQAHELGLDLVEISPDAEPPVCKIIDYKKFLYDKKKKERENHKSKSSNALKEIKMTPNIGDHDYSFKVKQAAEFLAKGNKVKATVFFKGREMAYKNKGEMLLLKFSQEVVDYGKVEQLPKQEGKFMAMIMVPRKKQ